MSLDASSFQSWIGIVAIVVASLAVIVSTIINQRKNNKKEVNDEEDRLNKLLTDTVNSLQDKVKTLEEKVAEGEKKQKDSEKKIDELIADNKKYIEIFQGIDKDTIEYRKLGMESIKKIEEIHAYSKTMSENLGSVVEIMKTQVAVSHPTTVINNTPAVSTL